MSNLQAFGIVNIEWDNNRYLLLGEAVFALISLLALGFLNTVFLNSGETLLATMTQFFSGLIIFGSIIFILEKVMEKTDLDFFETIGWGQNIYQFGLAILIGIFVAFILAQLGTQALIPPLPVLSTVIPTTTLTLVFVVFFAATVEEFFFRGTLLPTLGKMLQGFNVPLAGEIALFGQAIIFGLFHLAAYGVLLGGAGIFDPRIIASMIFGLIAGIGNGLMQFDGEGSTAFSYSLHLTNNFLAVGVI